MVHCVHAHLTAAEACGDGQIPIET